MTPTRPRAGFLFAHEGISMNITIRRTRGILIDPHTKTITEVVVDGDVVEGLCTLIDCHDVQRVSLGLVDAIQQYLWVDEEGILVDWDKQAFFSIGNYPHPLAGRGVIFASNDEGETISTELTVSFVEHVVRWLDRHGVVIPAPVSVQMDGDGNSIRTLLHGTEEWTYTNQPKKDAP
jgi:hypothetical protein